MEKLLKLIVKSPFRVYGKALGDVLVNRDINRKFYQLNCYLEPNNLLPFDLVVKKLFKDVREFGNVSNKKTIRKSSLDDSPKIISIFTSFTSFTDDKRKYYVTLHIYSTSRDPKEFQNTIIINELLYYNSQGFHIEGPENHPDALLDLKDAELNNTILIHKKQFNIPIKRAYSVIQSIISSYDEGYTQVKMVDYAYEWIPSSFRIEEYNNITILDDLIKSFVMAGFELRGDAARMLYIGQSLSKIKSREVIDLIASDNGYPFHRIMVSLLSIYRVRIIQSFLEKDYGINLYCEWRGMRLPRIRICMDVPFSHVETSINNSIIWYRDLYDHTLIHPSMFFRGIEESYSVSGEKEVSKLYDKTEGSYTDYRSIHFFRSAEYSPEYKVLTIHKMMTRDVNSILFFDQLMSFSD